MQNTVSQVLTLLDSHYPTDDKCFLHYETPWQLLFATIMSAQCTDDRVNLVTAGLYQKYATLEDFASASLSTLEQDIKSTGFYHNKAKNIITTAKLLLERFDGEVPSDIDALTSLPGVGRKTANVIRSHIFQIPSIVVDTHVKRISRRLGLTTNTDPDKIEFDLMNILPREHWIRYNTQIITFGRQICRARNPVCADCFMKAFCRDTGSV